MTDFTTLNQQIRAAERGNPGQTAKALDTLSASAESTEAGVLAIETQAITAAAAITLPTSRFKRVTLVGPASSTYAITLAAPTAPGHILQIEMLSTTSTNAVTLALTNVAGQSSGTTATFNAANERLVLISSAGKWDVLKEIGVTFS